MNQFKIGDRFKIIQSGGRVDYGSILCIDGPKCVSVAIDRDETNWGDVEHNPDHLIPVASSSKVLLKNVLKACDYNFFGLKKARRLLKIMKSKNIEDSIQVEILRCVHSILSDEGDEH